VIGGIRACREHGYFTSDACPDCGAVGRHVLESDRRDLLSEFVIGTHRGCREGAGISLDEAG
jgi:putative RNA 2'-phosphotransferase